MPFTPFHLGPAVLIGLLCRRWLDIPTFLAASVLVDIRATLVFFGILEGPLHGPLHTLLGATVVACVLTAVAVPVRPWADSLLDWLRVPQPASLVRIAAAALVGCWLHVLVDATLYTDMQLFAPIATTNPLLGTVGFLSVYVGCVVTGLLGLGLYTASIAGVLTPFDADSV